MLPGGFEMVYKFREIVVKVVLYDARKAVVQ